MPRKLSDNLNLVKNSTSENPLGLDSLFQSQNNKSKPKPINGAPEGMPKVLRIGCYARVSTEEQAKGENIETQVMEIEGYLGKYKVPFKVKWYLDDGISGTLFLHERPDGRDLMADVLSGQLDQVIIVRVDRIARDDLVAQVIFRTFKDNNIELISITEGFDYRTPHGQFMASSFATHASYERVVLIQRFAGGRIKNAVNGRWNGGHVPYGYKRDDNGNFIIDSDAAAVYTLIKNMALEGSGANIIRQHLKSMEIESPTGEPIWSKRSIIYILRNPLYLGKFKYMDIVPKVTETTHPPLVTQEEFDAIQEIISTRGHRGKAGKYHLLSGLIKCSCGTGYAIRYTGHNKQARRYCCQHRYESVYQCMAPLIDADSLEDKIEELIMSFAKRPAVAREAMEASREHTSETGTPMEMRKLAALEKQLTGNQKLICKKDDLFSRGVLSEEMYEQEVTSLYQRHQKLKADYEALKEKIDKFTEHMTNEKEYLDTIKKFKVYWPQMDSLARQQIIRKLIPYIQVEEDRLIINFGQFSIPLAPSMSSRGCWWFR